MVGWSCKVELDWLASLEHRFDHVASIDLATCAQPANISDEALVGHGPIRPEPMSTHSVSIAELERDRASDSAVISARI